MSDRPMSPDADDFEDPLQNYEPKTYCDALEEALAEQPVAAIQSQPVASISPTATVAEAVAKLAGLKVACLLVSEGGKLVGVFSDRDALNRVALEYDQVRDQPVSSVMTDNPIYVYDTDSAAAALCVMAVAGYRHVPVVDADQRIVGVVSPQRVTEFLKRSIGE